jgi:restriction system protein
MWSGSLRFDCRWKRTSFAPPSRGIRNRDIELLDEALETVHDSRELNLLLVGDFPVGEPGFADVRIDTSVTTEEVVESIGLPSSMAAELDNWSQGSQGLLLMAASMLATGIAWSEVQSQLGPMRYVGILGPDGSPWNPRLSVPEAAQSVVVAVNKTLVEAIQRDPRQVFRLSPRQFEELVAELLAGQGYDVALTPPSRDGGFDIIAVKNDALGRLRFLVECKRYDAANHVEVGIVRSLLGVVQQQQATAGVVVTTSFFTRGAKDFQATVEQQMALRDYTELQRWLAAAVGPQG